MTFIDLPHPLSLLVRDFSVLWYISPSKLKRYPYYPKKEVQAVCTILSPTGDTLTVLLAGEIDHHSAAGMRTQIDEAIERYRPAVLRLDFGGVTFMDSSGIGLVMGRYKLISTLGGTVSVVNIPKPLQKVMRLAGLDRLARIENGGFEA